MKAYDMAMAWIYICCGFGIVDAMGVFGTTFSPYAGFFHQLTWLSNPVFTIPLIDLDVTGITALATAMALATIVILNTNVINDRGIAMAVFAVIFWGSFTTAILVMTKIPYPGTEIFYTVFFLAAALVFINALVQFPTGGQKAHV